MPDFNQELRQLDAEILDVNDEAAVIFERWQASLAQMADAWAAIRQLAKDNFDDDEVRYQAITALERISEDMMRLVTQPPMVTLTSPN